MDLLDYIRQEEEEFTPAEHENGYICTIYDIKTDDLFRQLKNRQKEKRYYTKHRKSRRKEKEKLLKANYRTRKYFPGNHLKKKNIKKYNKYLDFKNNTHSKIKRRIWKKARVKEKHIMEKIKKYDIDNDSDIDRIDSLTAKFPKKSEIDSQYYGWSLVWEKISSRLGEAENNKLKGEKDMEAIKIVKWFIDLNPSLRNEYDDRNIKLDELLYFSNLMFYSLKGENLIEEPFEKRDNGPIIRKIHNDLDCTNNLYKDVKDKEILQILHIIDFVYGDLNARQLSEEVHKSSVWQDAKKNKYIDFSNISKEEKKLMTSLYETYANVDFQNLVAEKIGRNKYYYDKRNIQMTDELIWYLEDLPNFSEPLFLEIVNGELVFS